MTDKDKLGIKIFSGFIVFIIMIAIVVIVSNNNKQVYDKVSLCPKNIENHTMVLVDISGSLNKNQNKNVVNIIQRIKNNLLPLEKLSINSMTTYGDPIQHFTKCNPSRGEQANALYENTRLIQKKFDEQFSLLFNQSLDFINFENSLNSSPIMETIQILSNKLDFDKNITTRKLVIFSDMRQNSPQYSTYNNILNYETFEQNNANLLSDMSNIEVEIYFIVRKHLSVQRNNELILFWKDIFAGQGVSKINIRKLF